MDRSHKLPSFEGLRGFAALAVVGHHLRLAFYTGSSSAIRSRLAFLPDPLAHALQAVIEGLYNGTFAVWLFWIMSGFVLSLQFFLRARERQPARARDYLQDASLRRYPRLLVPVSASVAFAYAIDASGGMHNLSLARVLGEPYGSVWLTHWYAFPPSVLGALKCAVWQSFFAYHEVSTYNNVLWSMEKELYGSMFLFGFLGLLGHRSLRILAYPLIAVLDFTLHINWLTAFVAGIAVCDLSVNRERLPSSGLSWISRAAHILRTNPFAAIAIWAAILAGAGLPNYGGVSYLICGTAAVALTLDSVSTQRLLSTKVPAFLGKISFGVYLVHVPLICSFSCWAYLAASPRIGAGAAALSVSIATVLATIALGYVLYVAADRPGIRWSRWLSNLAMNRAKQTAGTPALIRSAAPGSDPRGLP